MTKKTLLAAILAIASTMANAQPRYDYDRLSIEKLDRGVVAVRQADGNIFISWRILRSDTKGQPFDVYRNGQKLNPQPLTQGGSFFIDKQPLAGTATYEVTTTDGSSGRYTYDPAKAPSGRGGSYISIPLQHPESGTSPDGRPFTYSANDASVADVDGDGQYEIILKWDPSNAHDNAHDGFTGSTLFDCYRLDGQLLWRIDMGRNIRSGAHYVPFIVYDFDGDGCAEFVVKTADGTRDALGHIVGDSTADWRHGVQEAQQKANQEQEGVSDNQSFGRREEWARYNKGRRPMTGRILTGPEYISVFDGLTGRLLDTKDYIPERGILSAWGDEYANRSDRMLAALGYFGHEKDGRQLPSVVFCRGYYTRTVLAAWDWDGRELKQHWVFDTNKPEWNSYAGQGNHNLRVADVDGDGLDEITYGSMAVDNDGQGLYNTGFGHGDAIHLMAFDPQSDRLQVWDCHENRRDGSDFRDACTGEVLFQIPSKSDVGRAMAADIDPTNPGVEMWSSDSHGVRNLKGEVVGQTNDADDPQHQNLLVMNGRHLSINFGIWWDGDLLRELLDRQTVSKYDWEKRQVVDVQRFEGAQFNNGTKSNPCLQADILGDWREEVITRDRESTELRIYTTTIPTDYRINCLMQDIPYRLSVAYQNVGYNQPPEPGYYIGPDRTDYTK